MSQYFSLAGTAASACQFRSTRSMPMVNAEQRCSACCASITASTLRTRCTKRMSNYSLKHLYDELFGNDDDADSTPACHEPSSDDAPSGSCMPFGRSPSAPIVEPCQRLFRETQLIGPPGLALYKRWVSTLQQVSHMLCMQQALSPHAAKCMDVMSIHLSVYPEANPNGAALVGRTAASN